MDCDTRKSSETWSVGIYKQRAVTAGVWCLAGACDAHRATAASYGRTEGRLYAVRKCGHFVFGSVGMAKCVPNCMEQNTYWKATSRLVDRQTAHLLWSQKVYYRLYKCRLVVCTLRQMSLLYTLIPLCVLTETDVYPTVTPAFYQVTLIVT